MIFQTLDQKESQFLKLVDNDNNSIELSYINRKLWLKFIGYFNSLYTRAIRAIINHAPIGEYRLYSSQKKISNVYTDSTLLSQGIIFSTSIEGLTTIRIQEETP